MAVGILRLTASGLLAFLAALATACSPSPGEPGPEVRIYAASSLTRALERLAPRLEAELGVGVRCSFAASSTLAQQIREGAPADLFLSAHPEWTDLLEREGLVEPGTRRDLLSNALVLVRPRGVGASVSLDAGPPLAHLFEGRFAVADPDAVPSGRYARRALEHYGWWDDLRGRLAVAAHVRGALALVERGECDLGAVYRSDAAGSDRVEVAVELPEEATGPIVYPVAAVAGRWRPEVRTVLLSLSGPTARGVFSEEGFAPLAPGDGAPDLLAP